MTENQDQKKKDETFKEILAGDEHARNHEILQKEINSPVFRINFKEFKKTKQEKEKLFNMKWRNKHERRKVYGSSYKKYLNIPKHQLSSLVRA